MTFIMGDGEFASLEQFTNLLMGAPWLNLTSTNKHEPFIVKEYARAEGVSAGFKVDSELGSDLSREIGVSETAECWEKVQRTSARPHVDLVPGGNGTGTRLMHADT